jgi:hypothetical protein
LRHIDEADEIGTVFRRISADVYRTTNRAQLPELSLSFIGEFYLRGHSVTSPAVSPAPAGSGQLPADTAAQAWAAIKDSSSVAVLEEFRKQFAGTVYADFARARIQELKPQVAAVPPAKLTARIEPASPSSTSPIPRPQAGGALAQKAVLYEEDPANPNGQRFVGSVLWRTEHVTPGPGQPPELAIRADIQVPQRKLGMTWSLRRNTDKTLPASHTVEIVFKLPPDFSSGHISNVPGILAKPAEQTRGTPLAGLAVNVTTGFFLIGLSSNEADKARNLELLKDREWFDIPIVYSNNRRAILAIEKGDPGKRVFAEAFKAWDQQAAQR